MCVAPLSGFPKGLRMSALSDWHREIFCRDCGSLENCKIWLIWSLDADLAAQTLSDPFTCWHPKELSPYPMNTKSVGAGNEDKKALW